ncbi:uncharacterized protein Dana_GF15655, isoform C [Drosophila ananassae]|uniref:Uncharacterized protein, isoform C n=1 Tax=Drosophila ananassae TaxID=7217 RepID=B3MNI6_DROAN|nr:GATA zinc finger domain-containing protein 14 isoform X1 [Drosophila ananassae]EDV32094.2 uncharacterized protein Dana_GF15655, isoform C [Drosophila ananassae]
MARRSNFIESNDNFREQNLRFVRNEFEDNINQFFEGANPSGGNQQAPPRRDSLIVQPTPDGQMEGFRSTNLDARRKFLLELGANRMVAHGLAVRSLKVPEFNLRDFQRQRFRLSVELGDSQQGVVDSQVLRSIGDYVQDYEQDLVRPRTPPPPRNIDWHQHTREESPEMSQRSRPRERREEGNSHGGPRGLMEQSGQDREPFPRNQGAINGSLGNQNNRRNANQTPGGEPNRRNQNTRNNSNSRQQNLQGRNSNPIGQRFVHNSNQPDFEQDTRNPNNRNANQPGNVNRNPPNESINGRGVNQVEFNRNNVNNGPSGPNNRNPNKPMQNRNPNNYPLNRNARNLDPQEMNRNSGPPSRNFPENFGSSPQNVAIPLPINRNENRNRNNRNMNMNDMRLKQRSFGNPEEFNHNNPRAQDEDFHPNQQQQGQNRQGPNRNNRNQHIDFRVQQSNFTDDNFGTDQNDFQERVDWDPVMEEQGDMGVGHNPQNQHFRSMGHDPIRPPIGRPNYQRIVHDNQITICRTDLMDAHERGYEEEDPRIPYGRNVHQMDNERFRGPQRSGNFERPGFRGPDEPNERFFNPNQSFEDHPMEESFDDNTFGRNDRYLDENHRHFNNEEERERRDFADHFDQSDSVRGGDNHRLSPRKHGAVRGSNNPNIPRNQYQGERGSGSVSGPPNRHRNDNMDGPNKPRNGPARRPSPGRNTNPGGPKSNDGHNKKTARDYSQASQDGNPPGRGPKAKQRQGPNRNPISDSSTSHGRNSNSGAQQPAAKRNANPRVGQKRAAAGSGLEGQKRRRVSTSRKFIIGGYSLPYIESNRQPLPQPEGESYAVTFFEQQPNYNTHPYANEDGTVDNHEESESDSESIDSHRSDNRGGNNGGRASKKIRTRLRKMWTKMYREKNYKDWKNWWKDFKWCGAEINKKLEKFGNINIQHRFIPKYGKASTEQVVKKVITAAHMGLEKNTNKVYRNMRSIFLLMNETVLDNLSEEQMLQVQDLIRSIPNHLWLYKIRSMVFLWKMFHDSLKTRTSTFVQAASELKAVSRSWENPLFHWLAKQAFDELKAVSEIAWPDHNKVYPQLDG